jgi:hypothetical protein
VQKGNALQTILARQAIVDNGAIEIAIFARRQGFPDAGRFNKFD